MRDSRAMTTAIVGSILILMPMLCALLFHEEVEAIPAFARKYKTSCTTCHIAVPKRNEFGEAFRRNGYVMPEGNDVLTKQKPVSLGAEGWKEVFPNSMWPGLLPAEFPISTYIHQRLVVDFGDSKKGNRVEFDMPHEFEIFIGGTLDDAFSFFGEFILFEKGNNVGVGKNGLKRLFFQANDVLGPKNALNIRMGRFEPGITDGLTDNNRVMLEHATTLDWKVTGKWRPRDQQSGIELNGIFSHNFQYALGVVNGEAKTIGDDTDEKDFYGRVAFKIGGLALDGYQPEEMTELQQIENWADNAITLGVYAYSGNYETDSVGRDNDFDRFGVDFHGNYDRFDLFAGVISGVDKNPFGFVPDTSDAVRELNSLAWFVEAYYIIYPWLIPGVRVGSGSSDINDVDYDKFTTISPNLTIMARANVRFTLEALIKTDDYIKSAAIPSDADKLRWFKANVMFAF